MFACRRDKDAGVREGQENDTRIHDAEMKMKDLK